MQIKDEVIYAGVRTQYIEWNDTIWNIQSNDRFEANEFTMKICCDICGPDTYVPKVIQYRGHRLCTSCLTRMIEMVQMATLEDCGKDRNDRKELEKKLKESENEK
jgi:hypothetical protein